MDMHMKLILGSVPAVCLAMAATASAAPRQLALDELDRTTAAGTQTRPAPNGGAIVGNNSTAELESVGEVRISDAAQSDVRALNFVNSSESTVANGVNVFDGRTTGDAAVAGARFDIEQENVVTQDQRRLASLPVYHRGRNTETLHTESGSSAGMSSTSVYDEVSDVDRTTSHESASTKGGFELSGAPTLSLNVNGQAGDDFQGQYIAEFNAPSAEGSAGLVFNGGVDFNVDAGQIDVNAENQNLRVIVDLPELDIGFDAMGCLAMNGDCEIDGTRVDSSEELRDLSTLYTLDESESHEESWSSSTREVVEAPFALQDAQAEYVVVDDSDIDVSAMYLVHLSGGAQSGLRAMNAVNAAGSAVANGVNVATSRNGNLEASGGLPYNLKQSNTIHHSR